LDIWIPSQSTRESAEKTLQHYEGKLLNGEDGRTSASYLKARGLTKETVQFFRLGLVSDPPSEAGHDFMVGRIAIPYITPTGIVQMRFRAVPKDGIPGGPEASPKMMSEPGAKTTIYNVGALNPNNQTLYVAEGESDTWSAHQAGLPTIGIPGARAWRSVFANALKFRNVVVLADNDDHGEGLELGQKIQADLRGTRIVMMDKGYDVNKMLIDYGPEGLRKKVGLDG
jgi:DNA primase